MQETSTGKRRIAAVCAALVGIVFVVAGAWKILTPFGAGQLLEEMRVPSGWGPVGAVSLGGFELLAAFLLFMPAYRKWGALLSVALYIFFIGWIGYYYPLLAGKECSCFPIIKRAVNPMFFAEDALMLLLALVAFLYSAPVRRMRGAALAILILAAFAGTSFAVNTVERGKAEVPTPVIVDGKPVDLTHGKVLLFFYDPSCMHCDAAARFMSTLPWNDVQIVSIPVINPQWAASFLHDTHLNAETSLEFDKLKKAFPFGDPPYGVALVDGRVKDRFGPVQFTPPQPRDQLKAIDFLK